MRSPNTVGLSLRPAAAPSWLLSAELLGFSVRDIEISHGRAGRLTTSRPDRHPQGVWTIGDGPSELAKPLDDASVDVGWVYALMRGDETRTIRVDVSRGPIVGAILPDECGRAVQTRGRSVVTAVLNRDSPPDRVTITTTGLVERRPRGAGKAVPLTDRASVSQSRSQ
jgi:hypothetical protein